MSKLFLILLTLLLPACVPKIPEEPILAPLADAPEITAIAGDGYKLETGSPNTKRTHLGVQGVIPFKVTGDFAVFYGRVEWTRAFSGPIYAKYFRGNKILMEREITF